MRKLVFSSRWSKVKQALEEDNWQIYALRTNCGQRRATACSYTNKYKRG